MGHKGFVLTFKNAMKNQPQIAKQTRYLCIRFLLVLFLAISYCIFGGILFKIMEGDQEASYKCGKLILMIILIRNILKDIIVKVS